jgi:drug/metabolite transporter (DMT)-like permease
VTAEKIAHLKAMALLNVTCFLWACNILFGRMLSEFIGPLFIVAVRTLIGAVVFGLVIWLFGRRDLLRRITDWPTVVLMGLCGVVLFQILFYYGLRHTSILNAGIINSFIPLATALMAVVFLGEKLGRDQWLAVTLTIVGIAWIMSRGDIAVIWQFRFNVGDWLILGAVISWAFYGILGKRLMQQQITAMEVTALGLFVALMPVLPLALWEAQIIPPHLNQFVIFALAFISIGPAILCMFWWNRGVQLIGPAHAAIYMNLVPLYAALLSYVFVGEPLGWHHLGGGIMVIGASFYVGLRSIRAGQV